MDTHDHISVIEALSCLGDLPLQHLSILIRMLEAKRLPARQALFEQGDVAEQIYFIGSGRLVKYQNGDFCGRVIQGQMAGWDSFIHCCEHGHSLIAESDCFVYGMQRSDMDRLIAEHPEVLYGFLRASTPLPLTGKSRTSFPLNRRVGIFTFGDLKVEAGQVFKHLLAGYNEHNSVAHYTCEAFCQLVGIEAKSEMLLGHFAADMFAHLESEHSTVIYTATADDPQQWLQKIANQVDMLVLVVRDTTGVLPEWIIEFLSKWEKKPGLVIIHPKNGRISTKVLALWKLFEPAWHYRLHMDEERRWKSIARMVLGQAVNLILSGGGSLGAMHCGILKVLVDADFPIDTIGGASAGAGIAMSLGLGDTPETTAEKFHYAFVEKKPFKAYTLPFYSLLNPKRLDNVLKEISAGLLLEESVIPVHATVTNLTLSRAEVITTGPAWEALRMTGSLPGILPPYIKDGCAYIDGGVLDNFPVSVARQLYSGRYVGVIFNIPNDQLLNSRYEDLPNAMQSILAKLLCTRMGDYPRLGEVLTNALVLNSTSGLKDAMNRVDLLLNPPVPQNIGITSFECFDQLYEAGVQYAQTYLPKLQSPLFK